MSPFFVNLIKSVFYLVHHSDTFFLYLFNQLCKNRTSRTWYMIHSRQHKLREQAIYVLYKIPIVNHLSVPFAKENFIFVRESIFEISGHEFFLRKFPQNMSPQKSTVRILESFI